MFIIWLSIVTHHVCISILACPSCSCFTLVVRATDPMSASGWQAWLPLLHFPLSPFDLTLFLTPSLSRFLASLLLCLLWNVSGFLCEQLLSLVYELAQSLRVVFFQFSVRQAEWVIPGPPRTSLNPSSEASQVKKPANGPIAIRLHKEMCQFTCKWYFVQLRFHSRAYTYTQAYKSFMKTACVRALRCVLMLSHKSILPSC